MVIEVCVKTYQFVLLLIIRLVAVQLVKVIWDVSDSDEHWHAIKPGGLALSLVAVRLVEVLLVFQTVTDTGHARKPGGLPVSLFAVRLF